MVVLQENFVGIVGNGNMMTNLPKKKILAIVAVTLIAVAAVVYYQAHALSSN